MTEKTQTSKTYNINVDRDSCCGYGVCAEICPDVFGLDDDGIVVLLKDKVGEDLFEQANEAAYACPQLVIKVESQAS
jgi:ferredoxin